MHDITYIIKRDGRKTPFNTEKIAKAIYKAAKSVGGADYETAETLAHKVESKIIANIINRDPSVEEVQDIVEQVLIENDHAKTAKAYILYRAERTRIRESNASLMQTFADLTFKSAAEADVKRENANINGDTAMGTMLKYGSEGAKKFNELNVLDPEHSKAHINGDIHIHDLDFLTLTTTCCQIDLIKLFKNGFSTGHGHVRPPKSIHSYASLACIAIQSNQNDQHGGQSVPNFDYAMADGVRATYITNYIKSMTNQLVGITICSKKSYESETTLYDFYYNLYKDFIKNSDLKPRFKADNSLYFKKEADHFLHFFNNNQDFITINRNDYAKLHINASVTARIETDKMTYQAMESFIHNLNTMHSRAGAQVPFSSINYGTDTSPEGQLVIENLLKATNAGLGNGETPIFPVQIFKVKEGVNYNPGDPNYELFKYAMKTSAKRMFPNFSFLDAPFNLQYYKPGDYNSEVCYMGCRTRVMGNVYDPDKQITSSRGNLSFTTINLPRLAIESNKDIKLFYSKLDKMLKMTCDQLYQRYKIQAQRKIKNYPFLMGQHIWIDSENLGPEDTLEDILRHGTLSVGFIGLAETLVALTGKHHGEDEDAQKLGLEIINHMREYLDTKSKETKFNYTLLATPAEGLSGRFVNIDKKKFGIIPGVTDQEFYTNSFHVPVYYNISAFKKINIESPYHNLTNAGHISYIELDGDPLKNLDAFEQIIRHMKESGIGYGAINHPIDRDPCCGYNGIIDDECPNCHRHEVETVNIRFKRPKF